jgi:hypothetical protein
MRRIHRQQCIDELRARMLQMTDNEHSMCSVAAKEGIYCKGFSQWTFEELKRRYAWIVASRPHVTRAELEKLANAWQLARQAVFGTRLSCDTQTLEHDTCRGFDGWTDADLARYHRELCGEAVEVFSNRQNAAGTCA